MSTDVRSRLRAATQWMEQDAARDGVRPRVAWAVFWAPAAGLAVLAVLFVTARPLFYLLQEEDNVVEWLQFALCLFTALAAGLALARVRLSSIPVAALLAAVALGSFFLAGEEISWGQRVLGIATPEALAEANRQAETNLHNIDIGVDPQLMFKLASIGLGALGLVGIVAVRLLDRGNADARLVAPPAFTAVGFAGIIAYWIVMVAGGNHIAPLLRFQEWVEASLYISLAATVVVILARVSPAGSDIRRAVLVPGVAVLLLTLVCAVLTPFSGVLPGNV